MATRSVRLDDESEHILKEISRTTGMSASEALKRGLRALRQEIGATTPNDPFRVYERLDLGPGGYAEGPSDETRSTARRAIRRKHGR